MVDDVLTYWLGEKNRTVNGSLYYGQGFMKAAFGSFIEGLDVIYCNDLCADIAAERFNVTWIRTSPMVMSVHDDIHGTVLSGESSFYFGRTAYGDPDDVKSFYFACSASFSPIEHYVTNALFPNQGNNGSATVGLGFILDSGGEIEIVQDGDLTLIREVGSNEKVLVFDSSTGLLRDQIIVDFCGAYCYSDQQTDWACDFGQQCISNSAYLKDWVRNVTNWAEDGIHLALDHIPILDDIDDDLLGIAGSISMSVGFACLPIFPVGTAVGLGLIAGGFVATYYADNLNRGWSYQKGINLLADVGLSAIPLGKETKIGKIVISKGVNTVSERTITKSSNKIIRALWEKGGTETLYKAHGGATRTYVKYGTLESGLKTAYGDTLLDSYIDFMAGNTVGYGLDCVIDYTIPKVWERLN